MGNTFSMTPAASGAEDARTLTFCVAQAGELLLLDNPPNLSAPTGAYGAIRMDTGATVVADTTPYDLIGDFLYQLTFSAPEVGLDYRYYIEVVVDDVTYYLPRTTLQGLSAMLAVGRYTTSHQVENVFGVENHHKWLSLDGKDEAADYALRAYQFLDAAECEIDDYLRGGPCEVPFSATDTPKLIANIAASLAGVKTYESRGVVDMNEATGQVQHRLQYQRKWVEEQLGRIKSGQIRLEPENVTRYPVVLE